MDPTGGTQILRDWIPPSVEAFEHARPASANIKFQPAPSPLLFHRAWAASVPGVNLPQRIVIFGVGARRLAAVKSELLPMARTAESAAGMGAPQELSRSKAQRVGRQV